MANHFSSIGLKISEHQDFLDYFKLAYENGIKIKTDAGTYVKWHIGNGVELWGQLDKYNNAIGMNPHFSGKAQIKVKIEKKIKRDNDTALDGSLYCWAAPDENENSGLYPFVLDLPDLATYGHVTFPKISTIQITGFAHEITAYKDAEEFSNFQEGKPKFASESFIPAGLFDADGTMTNPPQAMAIMSGHVIETQRLNNPYTKSEFIYARINSFGGEFDIVAEPELLTSEICIDGIVSGTFWLSGRVLPDSLKEEKRANKFSIFRFFK